MRTNTIYLTRLYHLAKAVWRARHMPFSIGEAERDQWMYCMILAMQTLKLDDKLMQKLAEQLYGVADFMRNQS